jgi:2-dehydro-3-deoxy-D-arabinonate dehydratase
MRLGQIKAKNRVMAAIFEEGEARAIPDYTMIDLIRQSEAEKVSLTEMAAQLASSLKEAVKPIIPIQPAEVWACGCTYETSATFRDAEIGSRESFYAHVFREVRPEIFFKGTARVCVGSGDAIGIRADSQFTAPEAELAVILGSGGKVLGYTLANDVSAWDIERENPLYLPQSKVYTGCCALGPVIVTPDEIADPYALTVSCTITRDGKKLFSGTVSTGRLARKIEDMVGFLFRSNLVPVGSVLLTGTGIIVTEEAALTPGDIVAIQIPEIGELVNVANAV